MIRGAEGTELLGELWAGTRWCLYDFVRGLGEVTLADSAGIVRRIGKAWRVSCEFRRPGRATSLGSLSGAKTVREWLGEPARAVPSWTLLKVGRRNLRLYTSQVWCPDAVSRTTKPHLLVVVEPLLLSRDPKMAEGHLMTALTLSWFAWAAYQATVRTGLCQLLRAVKGGGAGEWWRLSLAGATAWPMPFGDLVEMQEAGLQAGAGQGRFDQEWADRTLRDMHLTEDKLDCVARDRKGKPCCLGEPARKRLEKLASLIPWRSASLEHGRTWPRKAESNDFERLKELGTLFLPEVGVGRLNEKGLGRFFAHAFWRQWVRERQKLWDSDAVGDGEKLRWLRNCTNVAHYLLAGMPADEKAIEGMVWAVARYGHDVLGVELRLEIGSHLLHAARSEPALHVLRPFYRDHFFHAIEVCFLGHLLLETRIGPRRRLADVFRQNMKLNSRAEVLREWYVAALFHDVGYSVEVLKGARGMLEFFGCSPKAKRLVEALDQALDVLSAEILSDRWEGYTGATDPGRDHGAVAAEHLRGLVKQIGKKRKAAWEYRAARRAIALHNQPGLEVDFATDPLGVLLILCDTIQEWNRPHLRFSTAPAGILSWMLEGGLPGAEGDMTGPLEFVGVNLENDGDNFRMADPRSLEFEMHYGEEVNKNAGVFNLWLDSCSNLQRLRIEELDFDVKLSYTTPAFVNSQKVREWQMHRLKMAAEETHMSFLADWFPGRGAEQAVTYTCDTESGTEILTVDLKKLCTKRPITAGMEAFRERLARWRDYNEDRDFAGDYAQVVLGQE